MRGKTIFHKGARKVRAWNLLWLRREIKATQSGAHWEYPARRLPSLQAKRARERKRIRERQFDAAIAKVKKTNGKGKSGK